MKKLNTQNTKNVFTSLLSELHVKYTTTYADKLFNEHPHKYDLYGISKILSDYKIANVGVRVNNKAKDLYSLTVPFVAHISNSFVTVSKVANDKVYYRWDNKDIENDTRQFIDLWSGIVLLAEPDESSIEPDYHKHRRVELFQQLLKSTWIIAIAMILALISWKNHVYENIGSMLLIILNLIGAYIGYLLVLKQINVQSNYADKICSLFKQGDCNNVLESSAAKFMGLIGWSEIGFGYFITNIFLLICMPSSLEYVAIINLFALPYSFWSVWYQKFKAKQWCPLCLTVQVLFSGIFIVNLAYGFLDISSLKMDDVLLILSVYASFIIGLAMIVPRLSEGQQVESITQEMNGIKMKDEVFLSYLNNQPYYEVSKSDSRIMFGNPNSSFVVTILTNPHCSPCAKMHKRIDNVLTKIGDNICLQYIFSSFNEELDYTGKFLTAIYLQKSRSEAMSIFNEWYEKGKYDKDDFFSKYKEININDEVETEYAQHQKWRFKTKISATPTILINGYELPSIYKVEEIEYFIGLEIDIKKHC